MDISNQIIPNVSQIGLINIINDIYTAEAVAPNGEKMYLAMEPLGNDKNKWKIYINRSSFICNGGDASVNIGGLVTLGSLIHNGNTLKKFLACQSNPYYWTSDEVRFKKLCADLQNRKITDNSSKAKELMLTPHASRGVNLDKQTHMVYVSKVPINGPANFDVSTQNTGFGKFVDCYKDLVMSVGVTINEMVENRGIFRNPLSVVEGGYGGIAMMVHSFTCMVIQDYYPSIETFRVNPFGHMAKIFLRSLPKEQITIDGVRGDEFSGEFIATVEKKVLVPVAVLANLHRAK